MLQITKAHRAAFSILQTQCATPHNVHCTSHCCASGTRYAKSQSMTASARGTHSSECFRVHERARSPGWLVVRCPSIIMLATGTSFAYSRFCPCPRYTHLIFPHHSDPCACLRRQQRGHKFLAPPAQRHHVCTCVSMRACVSLQHVSQALCTMWASVPIRLFGVGNLRHMLPGLPGSSRFSCFLPIVKCFSMHTFFCHSCARHCSVLAGPMVGGSFCDVSRCVHHCVGR